MEFEHVCRRTKLLSWCVTFYAVEVDASLLQQLFTGVGYFQPIMQGRTAVLWLHHAGASRSAQGTPLASIGQNIRQFDYCPQGNHLHRPCGWLGGRAPEFEFPRETSWPSASQSLTMWASAWHKTSNGSLCAALAAFKGIAYTQLTGIPRKDLHLLFSKDSIYDQWRTSGTHSKYIDSENRT